MRKLISILVGFCMSFAVLLPMQLGVKEAKAEEPAGPVLNRKQVVTLNLFGNEVLATVLKDEADTVFSFSYTLGDKEVTASGEIKDGQYVVTDDPAGVGKMVIKDIVSMLTDEWA